MNNENEFLKFKNCIVKLLDNTINAGQNIDLITMESKFVDDLGVDSLDLIELIMIIEEDFDLRIPEEGLENLVTVGDAFNHLLDAL